MKHFNETVANDVKLKLKEFADKAHDDFISDFKESNGCSNIDIISGIHESGYIPLQKGGFMITEFYHNDLDSSFHFNNGQTEFNDKIYESFLDSYANEKSIDKSEIDFDDYDFQNAELDLFDSAMLRLSVYVSKDDKINIELSVNYKDMPYYRLKYDDMLKELSYSIDDFMNADFDTIFELFKHYR